MGLDMYLSARFFGSEYSNKAAHDKLRKMKLPGITIPRQYIPNYSSIALEVPVAYWRKANHIHSWFVSNVQDDVDDCKAYGVGTDQLEELAKLCAEVCAAGTESYAEEHLPCADGFFFGDDAYDKYYFEQTQETLEALNAMLADIADGTLAGWDFLYQASW